MKNSFKLALKIYKYLFVAYTIAYWIYIIIDDFVFVEKYGLTLTGIGIWLAYYLVFLLGLSFYF